MDSLFKQHSTSLYEKFIELAYHISTFVRDDMKKYKSFRRVLTQQQHQQQS